MFPSTLCLWCQVCGSCLVALGDTTLPNGWSMMVVFYLDKTWIWRMHSLLGPLKFNLFQGSFKIQMVQWWKWMIWARKPKALDLMLMGIDKNQALVNFSVAWERGKPTKGLTLKVAGFDSHEINLVCVIPCSHCSLVDFIQGSTFNLFFSRLLTIAYNIAVPSLWTSTSIHLALLKLNLFLILNSMEDSVSLLCIY